VRDLADGNTIDREGFSIRAERGTPPQIAPAKNALASPISKFINQSLTARSKIRLADQRLMRAATDQINSK
jgi:hypothetical protein